MITGSERLLQIVLDVTGLGWMDRALCAETDPEAFFPELGEPSREAKAQHRPPVAGEDRNSPDMVPPVMLSLSQHRPPVAGEDRNRGRLRSKLTRTMCQHCGPPTSTQAPDPGYEEPGHAGAGTAVRRKAARSRADR